MAAGLHLGATFIVVLTHPLDFSTGGFAERQMLST